MAAARGPTIDLIDITRDVRMKQCATLARVLDDELVEVIKICIINYDSSISNDELLRRVRDGYRATRNRHLNRLWRCLFEITSLFHDWARANTRVIKEYQHVLCDS